MNTKLIKIRNSLLLIVTSIIWGFAFVAQSEGGKAVGAFSFNGIRNLIAAVVLIPVIYIIDKVKNRENGERPKVKENKDLLIGGVLCGIILFSASTMQQLGLYYGETVAKAGFLTSCYILLVPVLGIFLHKKCRFNIWVSVILALMGLYLLCIKDSFTIEINDAFMFLCALLFAVHILVIDYFSPRVDAVKMSSIQFFVCAVLSIFPIVFCDFKIFSAGAGDWIAAFLSKDAWLPIIYAGFLSSGVGYTLQIVGQNGLNPTVASLLLSLESVFSVLAGWILLNQKLSFRELLGCLFIFAAILIAQIPIKKSLKLKKQSS